MSTVSMRQTFWIIDGYSLLFQSFYGVKENLITKNGVNVNGVYGALRTLLAILNKFKPTYITVALDTGGATFRDSLMIEFQNKKILENILNLAYDNKIIDSDIMLKILQGEFDVSSLQTLLDIKDTSIQAYKDNFNLSNINLVDLFIIALRMEGAIVSTELQSQYKANRKALPPEIIPQFDIFKEMIGALGIKYFSVSNYEADDVIASLVKEGRNLSSDLKIVIASRDKDLMQLIDKDTEIYNLKYKKMITIDDFQNQFGFMPDIFCEYLALVGDKVDNLSGVPGIGEKQASSVLKEYQNISNFLKMASVNHKTIKILKKYIDLYHFSISMIKLYDDLKLMISMNDFATNINRTKLSEFSRKYEFNDKSYYISYSGDHSSVTKIEKKKADSVDDVLPGFLF